MKDPWVPCLADDLSDPMVIATTASQELRHGSVSGTLGWSELARIPGAGEGDFIFDYRGVAVANRDPKNVYGRSSAARGPLLGPKIEWFESETGAAERPIACRELEEGIFQCSEAPG